MPRSKSCPDLQRSIRHRGLPRKRRNGSHTFKRPRLGLRKDSTAQFRQRSYATLRKKSATGIPSQSVVRIWQQCGVRIQKHQSLCQSVCRFVRRQVTAPRLQHSWSSISVNLSSCYETCVQNITSCLQRLGF